MTKHFTTGKDDLTGSSSAYYKLPEDATDIQDLIEYRNMNFAQGNILKAIYRIGEKPGTDAIYDFEKIIWFANREIKRLAKNDMWCLPKTTTPTKAEAKFKDILANQRAARFIEDEKTLINGIMKNVNLDSPVGTEIVYTTGDKAGQPVDPNDVIVQTGNMVDNFLDTYSNTASIDKEFHIFTSPESTVNPWENAPMSWLEVTDDSPIMDEDLSDDAIQIITVPKKRKKT